MDIDKTNVVTDHEMVAGDVYLRERRELTTEKSNGRKVSTLIHTRWIDQDAYQVISVTRQNGRIVDTTVRTELSEREVERFEQTWRDKWDPELSQQTTQSVKSEQQETSTTDGSRPSYVPRKYSASQEQEVTTRESQQETSYTTENDNPDVLTDDDGNVYYLGRQTKQSVKSEQLETSDMLERTQSENPYYESQEQGMTDRDKTDGLTDQEMDDGNVYLGRQTKQSVESEQRKTLIDGRPTYFTTVSTNDASGSNLTSYSTGSSACLRTVLTDQYLMVDRVELRDRREWKDLDLKGNSHLEQTRWIGRQKYKISKLLKNGVEQNRRVETDMTDDEIRMFELTWQEKWNPELASDTPSNRN